MLGSSANRRHPDQAFHVTNELEHALRLMSVGPSWIKDDGKVHHLDSRPACVANINHQGGEEDSTKFQRLLIEFCCSIGSKLRTPREASKGCRLIRVTESEDGSTQGCHDWLARQVKTLQKTNPHGEVLLYASLPCAGGSRWENISSWQMLVLSAPNNNRKDIQNFSNHFRNLPKKSMDHTFQVLSSYQRIASIESGQWSNRSSKDINSSYFRSMVASLV